jgi:hypothetical protein
MLMLHGRQTRHCHKCDYCYSPVKKNYVRSIYMDKKQAMEGQYGHLNNCKDYSRQKLESRIGNKNSKVLVERNVLTNQFPVVVNGPFQAIMQMEEYSRIYAPQSDEAEGNVNDVHVAEGNVNEMDEVDGNVNEMDEAEVNENETNEAERNAYGLHFQRLLLENLYNYFCTARKRRPNRTKKDIDAGITMQFVNNRTLGRFFCFATEWQLPAEGMEDLFSMIDSITQEDLNGQLIPKHKWSAIRSRFDDIIKLFNTTRRRFFLRPEVFGLDRHGQPFAFQGVISDILQDIGLALLEIKETENFAITFKESRENNIRKFGVYIYYPSIYVSI